MIDVLLGAPLIFFCVCVLRALCLKEQSRWALDHWNGTGWYRHLFFCYLLLCIFAYFQIFQSVPLRKLHLSYCAWLHRIASQQGRQRYAARQEFTDKKRISKRLVLFSYWKNVDCSSSKLRKGNVWTYFSLFVIRTRLLQCVLPQNTGCETFTCKLDRLDKLDSNLALRRIQRRGWVFLLRLPWRQWPVAVFIAAIVHTAKDQAQRKCRGRERSRDVLGTSHVKNQLWTTTSWYQLCAAVVYPGVSHLCITSQ